MTEGLTIYRGRSSEQVKIDLLHQELDEHKKLLEQYRDEYTKLFLTAALVRSHLMRVSTKRRFFPDLSPILEAKRALEEVFK